MSTKLDIQYDPTKIASALKAASTQILVTAKSMDSLGSSAVGAAEDLYGFESAEWKAADAAEKAERDVRNFADDLDYLAKEARDASRELDTFGDKAVKAGTSSGSFRRAGGQIGSGIAGALGGAAAGIVTQITQILGEKLKESGKTTFFSALLKEGQPALAILGDANLAATKLLESIGLLNQGTTENMILAEEAARNAEYAIEREARLAAQKEKTRKAEEDRLAVQKALLEGQARVQAILDGDKRAAEEAERKHWTESLTTLEEIDEWYKSIADAAKVQAQVYGFSEQKAKELEATLKVLRDRRAALEQESRDKKAKAEEDARQKTLKAEEEFRKQREAAEDAAAAEAKKRADAKVKGIQDSGLVDEVLGGQSDEDIDRQVKANRRGELARRQAEIDEAPDFAMSRRQKTSAKQQAQREIFGQPASQAERDQASGQLAQATINEAAARQGMDAETLGFMQEAVRSKVDQQNQITQNTTDISKLRAMMAPKTRARSQRSGRN